MVAQGEAHAEGVAKPWEATEGNIEPRRGDRTCVVLSPLRGSILLSHRYPGFRSHWPRFTLGYHRSPLRG